MATLVGDWWDADEPDIRVSGDLLYGPDELSLELRGTLDTHQVLFERASDDAVPEVRLILGESTGGKLITLENSLAVGSSMRLFGRGVSTQRFRPQVAYVGMHANKLEDLVWTRVTFEVAHLLEWFGDTGLEEEMSGGESSVDEWLLRYRYPETPEVDLEDGARLALVPGASLTGQTSRTLAPFMSARVTVEEARHVRELTNNYVSPFQDLLTLGTGSACPVTHLEVSHRDFLLPGEKHLVPVEVLHRSPRRGSRPEKAVSRHEMVFAGPDILPRWEEALPAWFASWSELRTVCALLFASDYWPGGPFENQVLNAVQAAEVFHRVTFEGLELSREEHDQRIAAVLDSAPPKHREWLDQRLKRSNEYGLGRRLGELYDHAGSVAEALEPNRREFIRVLYEARNKLAHEGRLPAAIDVERLFAAVEGVGYIVKVELMEVLGFSPEEAAAALRDNPRYQAALSR